MTPTLAIEIGIQRTENLLEIKDVCLSFGDHKVLEHVNAKIDNLVRQDVANTGQIVAFLGPSGVGKTQLLRILAGLQQPTSGGVFIGREHRPVHAGLVGLVSQSSLLRHNRTVLGNLLMAARQKKDSNPMLSAKQMLEKFGMQATADLYPVQLSGGQRQRIAIAQQLLCSEHFLLMDEPTAGLDPIAKKNVCQLVSQVANQDDLNTIVIVTHDIRSAISMADTLWVMGRDRDASGKIISGARIVKEYDLVERGLMWHPDVSAMPEFAALEREVINLFETL